MPMQGSTFLVREKGCAPKSLCVQATRRLGCVHMRDQLQGLFPSLCPPTAAHKGTRLCARQPHLRSRDEGAWRAPRPHGVEPTGLAVPPRRPVAPRPAPRRPACALSRLLQAGPSTCAIAAYDHLRPLRYEPADQLDQGAREVCGQGPLRAVTHPPGQRQGAPFSNHVDHQGHATAAHNTAVHDEPQGLEGARTEQDIRLGQKIPLCQAMVIVEPCGKAFDAACGLRPIGHCRGEVGQRRALAAHAAADERRRGVEGAGEVACGRSRRGLREGVADGLRAAKVVTPRPFLLCSIAGGVDDEPTFTQGPAKHKIMSINSTG
jgi:hypothetical protein